MGRRFWDSWREWTHSDTPLPSYSSFLEDTQDGIAYLDESPARIEQTKDFAAEKESEITEFFLTFGRYDAMVDFEAPGGEMAAELVLSVAKQGAVSNETLKALTADEYRDGIESGSGYRPRTADGRAPGSGRDRAILFTRPSGSVRSTRTRSRGRHRHRAATPPSVPPPRG